MTANYPYSQSFDFTYKITGFYDRKCTTIELNDQNMLYVIRNSPNLSIFYNLVKTAKFEERLNNNDANFTLFAFADDYVKSTTNGVRDRCDVVSGKADIGLATSVLNASIVNQRITKDLLCSSPFSYLMPIDRKNRMYITNLDNKTTINNTIEVVVFDIICANGVIHVIDDVILPVCFS